MSGGKPGGGVPPWISRDREGKEGGEREVRQASVMNQLKCYGVVCTTRVGWRGEEVGR